MLWDALGCSGILWDAFGMLWDALECSGMLWDARKRAVERPPLYNGQGRRNPFLPLPPTILCHRTDIWPDEMDDFDWIGLAWSGTVVCYRHLSIADAWRFACFRSAMALD